MVIHGHGAHINQSKNNHAREIGFARSHKRGKIEVVGQENAIFFSRKLQDVMIWGDLEIVIQCMNRIMIQAAQEQYALGRNAHIGDEFHAAWKVRGRENTASSASQAPYCNA